MKKEINILLENKKTEEEIKEMIEEAFKEFKQIKIEKEKLENSKSNLVKKIKEKEKELPGFTEFFINDYLGRPVDKHFLS